MAGMATLKRKSVQLPPQCTSTPMVSPNRKRKSFINIVSPRGVRNQELTEDSLLNINEDEAEKKAHRRSLALQSFQKTPAALSSPTFKKTQGLTPLATVRLNPDQLKQHYADCIKLSTENKINAKNAFGLHLLEYIDTILQEKSDNFQVVGCTIDAGAKIYAGRVDAVHGDILKMLGTIGNTAAEEHDTPEGDGEMEEGIQKKEKKKKKITLCEGRTIEKNIANIRNTTYDLSFDVDPLIQITTRQSDEQSSASLISYNVKLKNDALQFDSSAVFLVPHDEKTHDQHEASSIDLSHMESLIPSFMTQDRAACPTFDGFRFNNWVCTEEKSFYEARCSQSTQDSANIAPEPFIPGMDDLQDDDVLDDFGVDAVSSGDEDNMGAEPGTQGSEDKRKLTIDDLTLALQPTEYGYFNPRLAQMWAGPGHWKLKPAQVNRPEGEKKERKKKVVTTHTFNSEPDDLLKHFIKSRARTTLANETLRSNKSSDNILPLDIHYLESNLRKLSMMPLWRGKLAPAEKIMSSGEASGKHTEWYDYNNAHDTSNYCPNQPDDDSDDDPGAGEISFGVPDLPDTPIGGLELIDSVPKIEKINIQYAKQAKKIDVKKLKQVMWKNIALTDCKTHPNKDVSEKQINFSEIYKKLHTQVSSSMSDNLSVPIAFACLLHLANEHGLKLNDNQNLDDIEIVMSKLDSTKLEL